MDKELIETRAVTLESSRRFQRLDPACACRLRQSHLFRNTAHRYACIACQQLHDSPVEAIQLLHNLSADPAHDA